MKILHIIVGETPPFAGKLIASLADAGVDQMVIATEDTFTSNALEKAGVRILPRSLHSKFFFWQKIAVRRVLRREQPDIVHCWTPRAAQLATGNAQAPSRRRKPVIMGWLGAYENLSPFAACAPLVGATKDIVKHITKNGVPAWRAHFLPCFADIAAAPPVDRATLATPRDAKVLLSLSRLHPLKGLDTLIAALENVPDCILWLAGEGPLRRELENLAKKHNVIDRIRFLGRRDDHAALLRAADIFVLPSRSEPFPALILEAWAAGTAVIACDSAGPAALIENDSTGVLSPVGDAAAFATVIRRVRDDENLRRALVAQGYAAYIKDYAREAATRQWLDFYKSLLRA